MIIRKITTRLAEDGRQIQIVLHSNEQTVVETNLEPEVAEALANILHSWVARIYARTQKRGDK